MEYDFTGVVVLLIVLALVFGVVDCTISITGAQSSDRAPVRIDYAWDARTGACFALVGFGEHNTSFISATP
jgi:hypothetical protein